MCRAILRYVPLVPLILAVLLFVLMPFDDEARKDSGESAQAPAMAVSVLPGGRCGKIYFTRSREGREKSGFTNERMKATHFLMYCT
jgi:hypothetical protein